MRNEKLSAGVRQVITMTSLVFCLLSGASPALAQPVYETRGANGPMFSDKPQPGARAIELRPLNVIDNSLLTGRSAAEKGASPATQRKAGGEKASNEKSAGDKEAAVAYRSFSIAFPENDGSILATAAVFAVRLAVDPALRLGEGHAFVLNINGQTVAQRFTATEFMIPPEFWGDQLPPPNQRLLLGAMIVDRQGAVLKEAAPVQFQLRHSSVLQGPNQPRPLTLPAPPPATKATVGVKLLPGSKNPTEFEVKEVAR